MSGRRWHPSCQQVHRQLGWGQWGTARGSCQHPSRNKHRMLAALDPYGHPVQSWRCFISGPAVHLGHPACPASAWGEPGAPAPPAYSKSSDHSGAETDPSHRNFCAQPLAEGLAFTAAEFCAGLSATGASCCKVPRARQLHSSSCGSAQPCL